jgi:hypothetical protein
VAAPASGFRAFVILWCGQFVSLTGSALSGFALGVYVYQLTGSASALGFILALSALPFVLASPFTGSLVDRWGARRALLVGNVGALLTMLVLAGLLFMDAVTPWHVSVIVAFLAVFAALSVPAFEASVPLLVAKQDIGRANGLRLLALATSQAMAPVAAGFLLLSIGIYGIVLMDCLTFGLGILTLLCIRIPQATPRDEPATAGVSSLLTDFRLAWRYIAARRGLLALLIFVAALEFCAGVVDLVITPLILSFASSGALGVVLSIGGIGMIATSLAVTAWGGPRRRVRGVLGFSMMLAVAVVLGSLRPNVPLVAAAAFLFLGSLAIVISSNMSLWQTKVEPHLLGRAMALQNMVASVPRLVAYALAGLAADRVFLPLVGRDHVRSPAVAVLVGDGPGRGYALLMMVMGLLLALCVVLAYLYPPLRQLEDELPDVTPADVTAERGAGVGPAGAPA